MQICSSEAKCKGQFRSRVLEEVLDLPHIYIRAHLYIGYFSFSLSNWSSVSISFRSHTMSTSQPWASGTPRPFSHAFLRSLRANASFWCCSKKASIHRSNRTWNSSSVHVLLASVAAAVLANLMISHAQSAENVKLLRIHLITFQMMRMRVMTMIPTEIENYVCFCGV